MPSTVNGVGTTYFGKKNLEQYNGVCDSCNNSTTLSDYETGYYICVLFIPIIPLGRKMILGECPHCTRHRVVSVHDWEEMKSKSISQGIEQLSGDVSDPAKMIELLGTYTAFKQYDEARELAAAAKNQHWDKYDTVLTLGGWYEEMQMGPEAEECFARCLELDYDCAASKRIRAITHFEKNELAEGHALANELFASEPLENIALMFMLVNTYGSSDQDAAAYDVYKQIIGGVPGITEDAEFCKDIRKLEKKLGITESIAPKKKFFGLFG